MDALGDEQAVERLLVGAQNVGDDAVADTEDAGAVDRATHEGFRLGEGQGVDRAVGLAGHGDPAAERFVDIGEGAAAVDDPVAALDDAVGVGADQLQIAGGGLGQLFDIVLGRLGLVVDHAGDRQEGGVGDAGRALQVQALVENVVAGRAYDQGRAGGAAGQLHPGSVARGDEGLPAVAGHAEGIELGDDVGGRARRVGDQHDVPALFIELRQGLAGLGPAFAAVVDHAPDVAQQDVVVGGD